MKILIDKTLYVVGFFSIILFGVFIFGVFMLTGCSKDVVEERYVIYNDDNNTFVSCIVEDTLEDCYTVEIYTQDETRNLIDSLIESSEYKIYVDVDFEMNKLEDELWETNKKVNRINERVLELESELRDFERFEYEDLLGLMNEFDDWEDVLGAYILELEARIEELENPVIDEPLIPIYTQWVDDQLVFTMTQKPYTIILTVDKVYINQVEMFNTYDVYSMTICGDYCETEVSVGIPNRYTGEEITLEMRDYMTELQELLEFFGGE